MQREGTKAITLFEILEFFHCSQIKETMLTVITTANAVSWRKKKQEKSTLDREPCTSYQSQRCRPSCIS